MLKLIWTTVAFITIFGIGDVFVDAFPEDVLLVTKWTYGLAGLFAGYVLFKMKVD